MAKIPKFCPDCGTELGGQSVCEKCGFDTKITSETKKMSNKQSSGSKSTWDTLEPIVSIVGKWAWLFGVIWGVLYIILAFAIALPTYIAAKAAWDYLVATLGPLAGPKPYLGFGTFFWQLLCVIATVVINIMWVRPKFSKPCGEKDWETLLTNVWVIGGIQIPWMLIWGVILEIVGYGWGGAAVLICALLIIFLGPRKYEWKVKQ